MQNAYTRWSGLARLSATALVLMTVCDRAADAATAKQIDAAVQTAIKKCVTDVPRCDTSAYNAKGMLVFPEVTEAAIGIGGAYGEGALIVDGKTHGYYSTTSASLGIQLGAEKHTQIIMFMTADALNEFKASSGWEAGANANVTVIEGGKSGEVNTTAYQQPVIAFVFGQVGLMGDLSLDGTKVTKIDR